MSEHGTCLVADHVERVEIIPHDAELDRCIGGRTLFKGQRQEARAQELVADPALNFAHDLVRALVRIQLNPAGSKPFDAFGIVEDVVVDAWGWLAEHPGNVLDAFNPIDQVGGAMDDLDRVIDVGFRGELQRHLKLVTLRLRKELRRQLPDQPEAEYGRSHTGGDAQQGEAQHGFDRGAVAIGDEIIGHAVAPPAAWAFRLAGFPAALAVKPARHGRDHRDRNNKRGRNREDDRQADHADEFACAAWQHGDGRKGQRRGQRRGGERRGQMVEALPDGFEPRLALGTHLIEFIDHHDGIVDQQAERDDEAGHGHLVQRMAEHAEQDQHEADRQRNGHADHDGRAPAHGDEQDDNDDEGRKEQVFRQPVQAVICVEALVKDGLDLQARRRVGREIVRNGTGTFGPFVDALSRRDVNANQNGAEIVLVSLLR